MAERRMFAKTIIDSDEFLELPKPVQLLYFHLAMRADDDGFMNKPKSMLRMTGCCEEDLDLLVKKNYLIRFDSGVVVIRHWRVHNYLRNDRYKPTVYTKEMKALTKEINGAYVLGIPPGIPPVYQMDTQDRLGKERIDKVSIDQGRLTCLRTEPAEAFAPPSVTEVLIYCKQRKNSVDAEQFVDYYASNGWRDGWDPITDWKALVRKWEEEGR